MVPVDPPTFGVTCVDASTRCLDGLVITWLPAFPCTGGFVNPDSTAAALLALVSPPVDSSSANFKASSAA